MGPGSFHYDMFKDSLKFFKDTWLRTTTVRTSLDVTHSQPSHTHTHTRVLHTHRWRLVVWNISTHSFCLSLLKEDRQTNSIKPNHNLLCGWFGCVCVWVWVVCVLEEAKTASASSPHTHRQMCSRGTRREHVENKSTVSPVFKCLSCES